MVLPVKEQHDWDQKQSQMSRQVMARTCNHLAKTLSENKVHECSEDASALTSTTALENACAHIHLNAAHSVKAAETAE